MLFKIVKLTPAQGNPLLQIATLNVPIVPGQGMSRNAGRGVYCFVGTNSVEVGGDLEIDESRIKEIPGFKKDKVTPCTYSWFV